MIDIYMSAVLVVTYSIVRQIYIYIYIEREREREIDR